jgi:outer membrane protein TolC
MTLAEAVRLTLSNNLRLRAARYDSPIALEAWRAEIASFDTLLTAGFEVAHDETAVNQSFFGTSVLDEDSVRSSVGLSRRLHSGGEVALLYRADRLTTNSALALLDPSWTQGPVLEARQPILRGAGDQALADIRRAGNDRRAADESVRAVSQEVLLETVVAYWGLAFAQDEVGSRLQALGVAQELLEETTARFDAGLATTLDQAEARAGLEERRGEWIQAENRRGDLADRLRSLVLPFGLDDPSGPGLRAADDPREARGPPPDPARADEFVLLAMAGRPEILASEAALANRDIDVSSARDAVRPRLDLVGRVGAGGLDDGFGGSLGDAASGEAVSGAVGIEFSVHLGRRAARARCRLAEWARRQAALRHAELQNRAAVEVLAALREVGSAAARRESALAEVAAALEGLAGERDRLAQSQSTPFRVLEKESLLTDARTKENRATADLRIAEARFWRAIGRLPEHLGVAGAR